MVNPLVTDTPSLNQTPDPIEQEIPELYPSCAVTRAMAKKAIQSETSEIDLADTFIGQYFDTEIKESLTPRLSENKTDLSDQCSQHELKSKGHDPMSRSQLIREQHTDPEIFFKSI